MKFQNRLTMFGLEATATFESTALVSSSEATEVLESLVPTLGPNVDSEGADVGLVSTEVFVVVLFAIALMVAISPAESCVFVEQANSLIFFLVVMTTFPVG